MKLITKVSEQEKWVFADGAVPSQIRVMSAREINTVKHLHKTMHEYFYVIEGTLDIQVEKTVHHLQKDDALLVEPGEVHGVTGFSQELKLLLIMPPPVAGDKMVLPGE